MQVAHINKLFRHYESSKESVCLGLNLIHVYSDDDHVICRARGSGNRLNGNRGTIFIFSVAVTA